VNGDTVLVGSYWDDVGSNTDQGSVYVFTRSGTTWTQQARLTASDGATGDSLGISAAIDGNLAVAGAWFDDVGSNIDQGSAYVFTRASGVWTQQDKFVASDGAGGDLFGYSVRVDDDTAVAGTFRHEIDSRSRQGAAYVFTRSGSNWSQQAMLTASEGAAFDAFGFSVSVDGDTTVVGAAHHDFVGSSTCCSSQGAVYVFTRSDITWSQQAKLEASDGAINDRLGYSVAVSGATVIAGADGDDIGANLDQGSVYVFTRSGTTWTQRANMTASDGGASDDFGHFVALAGDLAVVGAPSHHVGGISQGSAYAFTTAANLTPTPTATPTPTPTPLPVPGASAWGLAALGAALAVIAAWMALRRRKSCWTESPSRPEWRAKGPSPMSLSIGRPLALAPGGEVSLRSARGSAGHQELALQSFRLNERAAVVWRLSP